MKKLESIPDYLEYQFYYNEKSTGNWNKILF